MRHQLIAVLLLMSGSARAYENIASTGKASQTDDKETYTTADKAIDGNTDGVWKTNDKNSISMPLSIGPDVFWKLNFDSKVYIDRVVVWNRLDYGTDRIDGLRLLVDGKLVKTFEYECSLQIEYVAGDLDVKASEVKLLAPDRADGTFSLAEVEVFGAGAKKENSDPAPNSIIRCGKIPRTRRITNIANQGVATQIDAYNYLTTAKEAIDGNTYGKYTGNSATSIMLTKSSIPGGCWWKLTFAKPVFIKRIVVWNRTAVSVASRIGGVTLYLDGVKVGQLTYTSSSIVQYPVERINKVGKEIKILSSTTSDGYLQMAEVQVYGEIEPQ